MLTTLKALKHHIICLRGSVNDLLIVLVYMFFVVGESFRQQHQHKEPNPVDRPTRPTWSEDKRTSVVTYLANRWLRYG